MSSLNQQQFKCLVDVGHANGCEVKECLCKKSAELEGPLEACVAPFGPDAIHGKFALTQGEDV